jgi:alkanesulfonate monooxygenase SsuD/methylene tetrahydromethanopterin reductase-like flavin-dependent oxidoreductase (luciferase family)
MRLSISLPMYNTSPTRFADLAKSAEDAGFHALWCYEMFHDPYLAVSVAAGATSRIGLGVGLALAPTRSPLVTAVAAADLHELSGGRVRVGLGAGDPHMLRHMHGVTVDKPLSAMREYVGQVRDRLRFLADETQMPGFQRSGTCDRIPVYVGAVRPRMLRMAGEVADGVMGYLQTPDYLAKAVRPETGDAVIITYVVTSIGTDSTEALRRARVHVGSYLAGIAVTEDMLPGHDLIAAQREVRTAVKQHGPAGLQDVLSDDLVRALSIVGTAEQCRRQLTAFDGHCDEVILHTPASPPLTADESAEAFDAILRTFGDTPGADR